MVHWLQSCLDGTLSPSTVLEQWIYCDQLQLPHAINRHTHNGLTHSAMHIHYGNLGIQPSWQWISSFIQQNLHENDTKSKLHKSIQPTLNIHKSDMSINANMKRLTSLLNIKLSELQNQSLLDSRNEPLRRNVLPFIFSNTSSTEAKCFPQNSKEGWPALLSLWATTLENISNHHLPLGEVCFYHCFVRANNVYNSNDPPTPKNKQK